MEESVVGVGGMGGGGKERKEGERVEREDREKDPSLHCTIYIGRRVPPCIVLFYSSIKSFRPSSNQ